jgi:hypothetical protein
MPRKTQARAPRAYLYVLAGLASLVGAGSATWAAEAPGTGGVTLPPVEKSYDFRNPPQGLFDEQWMEIFISGQKVGYAHQSFNRVDNHIKSESHEEFRVKRLSFELSATQDSAAEETLDGVPLAFHSKASMSDQPTVVDGRGDGKVFKIIKTVGPFHDTQEVAFPAGTLMNWGVERVTRLKGLAPGTTYEFPSYEPSDDAFATLMTRVTVGAREKVSIQGQELELTHVTMHLTAKSGIGMSDMEAWVDANYHTRKMTMDLGGLSMEMFACTEAEAKGTYEAKDIFTASLITLAQEIPPGIPAVTLNLRRADGKPLPLPPESATEGSEVLPDGSVEMTLLRVPKLMRNKGPLGAGLPDAAPYLARNSYLDTSNPLLRQLAEQAGGPAGTEPVTVAWQLRDFVADYINKKDMRVGFATAAQAAQSREGDCTEHAVLLAALGRIRGLPTRTVSGLVYIPVYGGQRNVLGFHMWTQFFFNGQWVDFDSALTDGTEPYWRLGLVASDLNEVSLSDFTLELMRWMSALKVTVVSAGPLPKK